MPSQRYPDLRSRWMAVILALVTTMTGWGSNLLAQENSDVTWQSFRIERNAAPGTYLTFQPPLTAITPYSITWSPNDPGNQFVFIGRLAGPDSVVLDGTLSSQYILELVSSGQMNIRRASIALAPGSPQAVPGYISNDFQGSRTSGGQTVTAGKGVILGGASNAVSAYQGAVGGGNGNAVSATSSVIVGGDNNRVSSYESGTLCGANNAVSANGALVLGGTNNAVSSNRSVILGGSGNAASANQCFIGGGASNSSSGDDGTLFGGYGNKTTGTHCIIVGGWTNTVLSTNETVCFGGFNNQVIGNHSFIGGGYNNSVISGQSVVFSGSDLSIGGNQCVGLGGQQNQTAGSQNTSLGGRLNIQTSTGQMTIGGGYANQVKANYTTINGGSTNLVMQQYSTIMGGYNGTINSQNSLLFSGDGANAMTILTSATFTTRNVDLVMATNDNTPRLFKFFENYGSTGAYPGTNTNYVGFRGPDATDGDNNNEYTWPDRIQTSGTRGFAVAASPAPSATAATTEWASMPVYAVTTVTANGTTTTLSAANLNVDQPIKINPNSTPANRKLALSNGTTDGFIVTVYVYNGTAGNGVRLKTTDANLALKGAADVDLDQNDSISFVWDNTSTKWIEIGRSAN